MSEQVNEIQTEEQININPKLGQAASVVTTTLEGTVEMDAQEQKMLQEKRKLLSNWAKMVEEIQFYHEKLMPNWTSAEEFDDLIKNGRLKDIDTALDDLKNVATNTDDTASQIQATYLSKAIALDAYSERLSNCENLSSSDLMYLNGFSAFNPLAQKKLSADELHDMMERNFMIAQKAGMIHCSVQEQDILKEHMLEKLKKMNENGLAPMLRRSYKAMQDEKASLEMEEILRTAKADQAKNFSDSVVEESKKKEQEPNNLYSENAEEDYSKEPIIDEAQAEKPVEESVNGQKKENDVNLAPLAGAAAGIVAASKVEDQLQKAEPKQVSIEVPKRKTEQKVKNGERVIPTKEEVQTYAYSRGFFSLNIDQFMEHYNSNGWMTNEKLKITNWHSTVDFWQKNCYHACPRGSTVPFEKSINCQMKDIEITQKRIDAGVEMNPNIAALAPTKTEVMQFFEKNKLDAVSADTFYNKMETAGWKTQNGKLISNWRGLAYNNDKRLKAKQKAVQKPVPVMDESPTMGMS